MKYDRQSLAMRRLQSENVDTDPIVWTNQRFIRWARSIDLGEYADNLKGILHFLQFASYVCSYVSISQNRQRSPRWSGSARAVLLRRYDGHGSRNSTFQEHHPTSSGNGVRDSHPPSKVSSLGYNPTTITTHETSRRDRPPPF